MKITTTAFDGIVAGIIKNGVTAGEHSHELLARVVMASGYILKHRQGLPDDAEFDVPVDALPAFLASLSKRQRHLLKKIAESLEVERDTLH
jgi:hypothetical protein